MPQENQSGKIGKSSSPSIQRVIENNKNVQAPVPLPPKSPSPAVQFNKRPLKP